MTPLRAASILAVAALSACASLGKEELEPSKDTFECSLAGDRYVIRLAEGEARLLLPGGERVVLYPIAAASGVRFTNGMLELRGRGAMPDGEFAIVRDGLSQRLAGCKAMMVPKS